MNADFYVRQVEWALRDLPWSQRRDLVADLRRHLAELPTAETDLASRLGTPGVYAADLRAAEGLERRRGPVAFIYARRPRNLVFVALGLIVVGLVIGTLSWINSYQPIADGNGFQYPPEAKLAVGQDLYEVRLQQGHSFEAGVSFVNDGRYTVHVTSIEPDALILPVIGRLYLDGPRKDTGGYPVPTRVFHPFDLKPGQVAYVVLRGSYRAKCHVVGLGGESFWELRSFELHYSFLWRTGVAEIDFPTQLQIDSPKNQICEIRP